MEKLRKKNRTVLEVELGIAACGIVLQVIALAFGRDRVNWCLSFLLGSILSGLAILHMHRTLDRALDLDEGTAQKLIYRGYVTRYFVLVAIIFFLVAVKWLNPLLVFLAYMCMKVAVYLQPFTHKLCNRIFCEEDPEPESIDEVASDVGKMEELNSSEKIK